MKKIELHVTKIEFFTVAMESHLSLEDQVKIDLQQQDSDYYNTIMNSIVDYELEVELEYETSKYVITLYGYFRDEDAVFLTLKHL